MARHWKYYHNHDRTNVCIQRTFRHLSFKRNRTHRLFSYRVCTVLLYTFPTFLSRSRYIAWHESFVSITFLPIIKLLPFWGIGYSPFCFFVFCIYNDWSIFFQSNHETVKLWWLKCEKYQDIMTAYLMQWSSQEKLHKPVQI